MLRLKTSLSSLESDILLQCLLDMENDLKSKHTTSTQAILRNTALISARKKVESHMYDCFYREEITNMVFALDSLSRKCNEQLTEHPSSEIAASLGSNLRTAAAARMKLKQATISHK